MKKFDKLTPIGVITGILLLVLAVGFNGDFGSILMFLHGPSFLIVCGGVLAAMLVSFPFSELRRISGVVRNAFRTKEYRLTETVELFVFLAQQARKNGLLSLEKELVEIEDPFIKKGITLTIDGEEADTIVSMLNADLMSLEERHRKGRMMIEKAGDYAPAWGMIGTLIGLVLMLSELDDPSLLGPNMAIALLTTLYGVLLANLVLHPIAAKLVTLTQREIFVKQVMIEGIVGVQSGQNPRVLEEQLSVYAGSDEQGMIHHAR